MAETGGNDTPLLILFTLSRGPAKFRVSNSSFLSGLGARNGAEAYKLLSGSVFQDWSDSNLEKQAYLPLH